MRMPNAVIEQIKLNYRSMSPRELNILFALKGYRQFKESTIQSKIDRLLEIDDKRELIRKRIEVKALEDPIRYRAKTLYYSARHRAKKKNIPFELTVDWIEDKLKEGICECTGINFEIKKYSKRQGFSKVNKLSPSLDQIIPSAGYTVENVKVVCDQFNKMKSDNTIEETYFMAKEFVNYQEKTLKNKREVIA